MQNIAINGQFIVLNRIYASSNAFLASKNRYTNSMSTSIGLQSKKERMSLNAISDFFIFSKIDFSVFP